MTQESNPLPILKIDVVEGVDRFAAEGSEETVLNLYKDWLAHINALQQKSADMFIQSKQVNKAEEALSAAGFTTKRLS